MRIEPTPPAVPADSDLTPTRVRYLVVACAAGASVMLYVDRVCIAELLKYPAIPEELGLGKERTAWTFSAFFWTYALAQVPGGWLGDRFGGRPALVVYLVAWSVFTALCGWATGFFSLFVLRLCIGLAQAGAYPTCGGLLKLWIPLSSRSRASSVVAFGGRLGWALAPPLTTWLVISTGSWRNVLWLYGLAGVALAIAIWPLIRSRPAEHPRVNAAERSLVDTSAREAPGQSEPGRRGEPWGPWIAAVLGNRSLWLMCLTQFATNIGWVFLISWFPTYLAEAGVPNVQGAYLQTAVTLTGMVGMMAGGVLADTAQRKLGLLWGRRLPIAGSRFVAAGAYAACLGSSNPYFVAAAMAVMALATDLGVAATWAYAQDVGGRRVGAVLGWGNMFGNIGAAVGPGLLTWVNLTFDTNQDWREAFMLMAASFTVAGVAALGIDAARPIEPVKK